MMVTEAISRAGNYIYGNVAKLGVGAAYIGSQIASVVLKSNPIGNVISMASNIAMMSYMAGEVVVAVDKKIYNDRKLKWIEEETIKTTSEMNEDFYEDVYAQYYEEA